MGNALCILSFHSFHFEIRFKNVAKSLSERLVNSSLYILEDMNINWGFFVKIQWLILYKTLYIHFKYQLKPLKYLFENFVKNKKKLKDTH